MNVLNILTELYKAFDKANELWFEGKLPTPVILITSNRGRKNLLGYTTEKPVWRNFVEENRGDTRRLYEIGICGEELERPLSDIIGTLCHEIVHLYNAENGIKDCSKRVHNKKFKEAAERIGLEVHRDSKVGYGITEVSPELEQIILSWGLDKKAFTWKRVSPPKPAPVKKGKFKYTDPLDPSVKLTSKHRVVILDANSGATFEVVYEPGDEEEDLVPTEEDTREVANATH